MINLEKYFKDIFDTREIIDLSLKKFAQDHIQRLTANNPNGDYDQMIDDTVILYTPFSTALSSEDSTFSQQQGRTVAVNNAMSNFVSETSDIEGLISYTYRNDLDIYEEFFPHGLTEYHQITLETAELLMDRMVNRITAYVGALGAPNVVLFTALRTAFLDAREEQLTKFGQVEGFDTAAANARSLLTVQLVRNLLIIASNNVGFPSRANDYFDQSIIRRPGSNDDGLLTGTVAALATVNIENEGITAESNFKLKNTGTTTLRFCLAANETDACATGVELAAGDSADVPASLLGPGTNTFFNVTNLSTDTEGSYEAEVL